MERSKPVCIYVTALRLVGKSSFSYYFIYISPIFSILVNMDDRMVEQFVDEDDFIIKIDFDNQLGHFELTLFY